VENSRWGVPIRGEVCVAEARKMQVTPSSLVNCVLPNPCTASAEDVSHEKSLGEKLSRMNHFSTKENSAGLPSVWHSAMCDGSETQKVPRCNELI
jgi:hypothetical protein